MNDKLRILILNYKKALLKNKTQGNKVEIKNKNKNFNDKPSSIQCYECFGYSHYTHKCANMKNKKGKTMHVSWNDSNDYNIDGSFDDSNNFIVLLFLLSLLILLLKMFQKFQFKLRKIQVKRGYSRCLKQTIWNIADSKESKYKAYKENRKT